MTLTLLLPQTALQSRSGLGALLPPFPGLFIFLQLSVGVRGARAEHRKGDLQGDFPESVLLITKALDRTSSPVTTH